MAYSVKEVFYSLQGEGANSGRPGVFCRFSGCNLWSGRKQDKTQATCAFCDTDFVGTNAPGGGQFEDAHALALHIASYWPEQSRAQRFVILTGGEPLLQVDAALVASLHEQGFFIAIETNGTLEPPPGIDWICVSPKEGSSIVLRRGQELKLVYPQPTFSPELFSDWDFEYFYLQPMDNDKTDQNMQQALAYCQKNPQWRLSLQIHKFLDIQ